MNATPHLHREQDDRWPVFFDCQEARKAVFSRDLEIAGAPRKARDVGSLWSAREVGFAASSAMLRGET
jgi:hypothetical protein